MSHQNFFQRLGNIWHSLPSSLQVVSQIIASLAVIIPSGISVIHMIYPPTITERCSLHGEKQDQVKCLVFKVDKEVTINIVNKADKDIKINYQEWQSQCGVSENHSRNPQSITLAKKGKEQIRMYAAAPGKDCREAFIFNCNAGKDNCYELLEVTMQWKKE